MNRMNQKKAAPNGCRFFHDLALGRRIVKAVPSAASCVCQFSFWRKSTSTRLSRASSSTIKTLRCMFTTI